MLLPPYHHHPTSLQPPPKPLIHHSLSSLNLPKTLTLQPKNKKLLILNSSSSSSSKTLPQTAIRRIADKLRSLGFTTTSTNPHPNQTSKSDSEPAGEIFIPVPNRLPKQPVGHTLDRSWSTPENPVPEPATGPAIERYRELWGQVWRGKKLRQVSEGKQRAPTLAELALTPEELRTLQKVGLGLEKKMKIGKAGITEGIINGIHERWRRTEVVKIVCQDLCRYNMKRTHDLLERKTGGLVVWRSGTKIILYRGANYKYPYFDKTSMRDTSPDTLSDQDTDSEECDELESPLSSMGGLNSSGPSPTNKKSQPALVQGVGSPNRVRFELPGEAELMEESDRLLDGLGPRFNDWWGYGPAPVDGDLLPAVIPGYRRPFRLLPFGVQPKLTNDEMNALRRLGRPLPCHFVLGRNRKLQGLATAIIKLWEKCEIAKIAVKKGVQNTNNELMAEELKWLTGGTLLTRNKEYIIIYRGKDFLPSVVSSAIEERRKRGLHGEKQSEECSVSSRTSLELKLGNIKHDSEDEFGENKDHKNVSFSEPKKLWSTEAAIERTSMKLSMALEKKAAAEKLLAELEEREDPQLQEVDKEGITEEERYMLRKVGLRMKPFLLMGRRGVFAGTVENMHLHWKYRELVKLICKERSIDTVHSIARTLEAESGGILVAVERVSKGYAIIVYRGKNYERPASLRPQTLLNKRQAMKHSLEAQRRESLKLHVLKLTRNIEELKHQMDKDKQAKSGQSVDDSRLLLAGDNRGAHLNGVEEIRAEIQATEHDKLVDSSLSCDVIENQSKSSSESVCEEAHFNASMSMLGGGEAIDTDSCRDNFMSARMHSSAVNNAEHCDEAIVSSVEPAKNESELSCPMVTKTGLNELVSKTVQLSNRDRLLLRKQALKMRKRPVLAVGKSNIVTGIAKTIKAHFERHPLAIVNIKGRAKGTSVREVVFKLQQATGAVLVSQEPNKVILYRGWGADEPRQTGKKSVADAGKTLVGRTDSAQPAVSPELMAAIRLECGLQRSREEQTSPEAGS